MRWAKGVRGINERVRNGRGLLAEYERALALRRMVREFGLTSETAPAVVAEAERVHGRIEVRALADGDSAELVLEGPVWESEWAYPGEISPRNVKKALDELGDVQRVNVYLNSPGGSPFAGHAIHGLFRRHAADVHVHITALAASAASIIAVGGDELIVYPNSTFMIHSVMMGMVGWFNAAELRKEAQTLDQLDKTLVAVYHMKTGRPEAELLSMVHDETWLVGRDIVDEGFADVLVGTGEADSGTQASLVPDEDIKEALETAEEALEQAASPSPPAGTADEPEPPEVAPPDDEDDEKLKLLSLELELLGAAPF